MLMLLQQIEINNKAKQVNPKMYKVEIRVIKKLTNFIYIKPIKIIILLLIFDKIN